MKNKKIIFILVIFLICVILGIFIYVNKVNKGNIKSDKVKDYNDTAQNEQDTVTFAPVMDRSEYFNVQKVLNSYYVYVKELDGFVGLQKYDNDQKVVNDGINHIYGMLDKQYIDELKVTKDDLNKRILRNSEYELIINKMYSMRLSDSVNLYIVAIQSGSNKQNILVKVDSANKTFSLFLNDYITEKRFNIKSNKKEINIQGNNIEKNEFNNYTGVNNITDEYICSNYLYIYKTYAIYYPDVLYEHFNKEYREKRYGSLNNFKEFVKENKESIENITFNRYNIIESDNSKQYVCEDTNEFYYIFSEDSVMNFSLIADTHTIDIAGFKEDYEKAKDNEKVAMNINKIVEALNMKDYGYVYSKFSDGFKKNYFKTEEDFKKFAKLYLKNNNKIKFNSYSNKSDTHVYNITLTDKIGKSSMELNTDILMKLGEGTDFVFTMSGITPEIVYNGF